MLQDPFTSEFITLLKWSSFSFIVQEMVKKWISVCLPRNKFAYRKLSRTKLQNLSAIFASCELSRPNPDFCCFLLLQTISHSKSAHLNYDKKTPQNTIEMTLI
jgi:hypothetical protein